MPYIKNHIKVKVPGFSGFDKSHRSSGTGYCGTLIPILCDEVVPNTRVRLRLPIAAQLPPLASDTYMNVKLKVEAFFCPSRLTCGSFEDFFCDDVPVERQTSVGSSATPTLLTNFTPQVPCFYVASGNAGVVFNPGTLADYLGIRAGSGSFGRATSFCALPFIVYHLIWQEYYRNPRVQRPCFVRPLTTGADIPSRIGAAPWLSFGSTGTANASGVITPSLPVTDAANTVLCDGVSVFSLRQRNFTNDYFTAARVAPQQGSSVAIDLPINAGGNASVLSIAALRSANSLQQFRERNNLPSPRLVDQVKARYNAQLSDGVAQRPICIGSASYDVNSVGVSQTSATDLNATVGTSNPFSSVSAQYGRASVAGNDFIIDNFTANEPGYIMVLMSLVPEASYSYGVDPMFRRYLSVGSITDMANPLLQNVGDQPIVNYELMDPKGAAQAYNFGYTDRYADWMFKPNVIHGAFRGNLSPFVLQRPIAGSSTLSSSFLEIPKNYLDQVMAVSSEASGFSFWYDAYLDYKISMPLAEYSIPSLQDPAYEHGQTVSLRRNGQIF